MVANEGERELRERKIRRDENRKSPKSTKF